MDRLPPAFFTGAVIWEISSVKQNRPDFRAGNGSRREGKE